MRAHAHQTPDIRTCGIVKCESPIADAAESAMWDTRGRGSGTRVMRHPAECSVKPELSQYHSRASYLGRAAIASSFEAMLSLTRPV
jgi:hypothetical protein